MFRERLRKAARQRARTPGGIRTIGVGILPPSPRFVLEVLADRSLADFNLHLVAVPSSVIAQRPPFKNSGTTLPATIPRSAAGLPVRFGPMLMTIEADILIVADSSAGDASVFRTAPNEVDLAPVREDDASSDI